MFRLLALLFLVHAACISSESSTCPGGDTVCGPGARCVKVPNEVTPYACADADQLAACKGAAEASACTVGGAPGTCFDGGCVLAACGDGVLDADPTIEMCDDGNQVAGDKCSADCKSDETCGNGIIDLAVGEECDDGDTTRAGDGCSQHCKREYRIWRDVTPRAPVTRQGFGLATDPIRGVTLVGGGLPLALPNNTVDYNPFNETWRADGSTWLAVKPPTTSLARFEPAYAYDPRRKRGVMVGGISPANGPTQSLWEWDGVNWLDRTPTGMKPPARSGAAMACSPMTCVFFGGNKSGQDLDDTWLWDGTSWTPGPPAAPLATPSARSHAAMAYDPALGFVLYGGTSLTALSDIWVFKDNAWSAKGTSPGGSSPSMAYDYSRSKIVLVDSARTAVLDSSVPAAYSFSGLSSGGPPLANAAIAWDPSTQRMIMAGRLGTQLGMATLGGNIWTVVSNAGPTAGQYRSPAAYDPRRGTTIVLDSQDGTFEWNGIGWRFRGTGPGKEGTSLANDPGCGVTFAFGGGGISANNPPDGQLSRFPTDQGAPVWQTLSLPGVVPAARTHHAMAYDVERKALVLFGGVGANVLYLGDTWTLTNVGCLSWTWARKSPAASPSARYDAQLAYDPVNKVVLLFGGRSSTGSVETVFADTWAWDGVTWRQLSPSSSPLARYGHSMAVDPRRQRIVLYGGHSDGNGNLDDSWEWTGTTWSLLSPALVPPERSGAGFAPDVTGGLVAVNGNGANGNVVLRLTSELSTELPDRCQLATVDSDGDNLRGCADPDCAPRCTVCGNGMCDQAEDYLSCPGDCPVL